MQRTCLHSLVKVDVPNELVARLFGAVGLRVNPHVNHHAAGFQPIAAHKLGLAQCCNDDVTAAAMACNVLCPRVANRDGGIKRLQVLWMLEETCKLWVGNLDHEM